MEGVVQGENWLSAPSLLCNNIRIQMGGMENQKQKEKRVINFGSVETSICPQNTN
jgi:hypothetical protein